MIRYSKWDKERRRGSYFPVLCKEFAVPRLLIGALVLLLTLVACERFQGEGTPSHWHELNAPPLKGEGLGRGLLR